MTWTLGRAGGDRLRHCRHDVVAARAGGYEDQARLGAELAGAQGEGIGELSADGRGALGGGA
jgi:hypothetical protein